MRLCAAPLVLVRALVAAFGLALGGCALLPQQPAFDATAALPCLPDFPYEDGWLGGDAAYSVPLSTTDTLWLFGDSFVGEPGSESRAGSSFIHNSVGVSRCRRNGWRIDYYWGSGPAGAPRAFLHHPTRRAGERWWWLFDGFHHDGRLYLGVLSVERTAPTGPLALPFRFVGMQLARVANPEERPDAWRTTLLPLWGGSAVVPGSALVVHDGWLHLFGFLQGPDGSSPRMLARLPLAALEASAPLSEALEYLARDGSWKPGLDAADARLLMRDDASEMSVVWRADLQRWLATYSHPEAEGPSARRGPSTRVFVRTALALEGPWSRPYALFEVPELSAPKRDPDTACYAAKEHRQFSRAGGVTFTYVCNLFAAPGDDPQAPLARLLERMDLYRPRAARQPLPDDLLPGDWRDQ